MKRLCIVPTGLPCTFDELEPGLFVTVKKPFCIGIKDEYDGKGYCESGEYWCDTTNLVMPAGIVGN